MSAASKNFNYIVFVVILLLGCTILYHDIVFMYPAYMHDWAQADRLSLAINFYDRGMDFFKPATHSLYSVDGITGVEFPIVSYFAAALGHIFGRASISTCFRALNIGIACTGLFFLFHSVHGITKQFWLSAFLPAFVFCAPVYTFYLSSYLPDATGASIVFIGFFFMIRYLQQRQESALIGTIVCLTLATLIKTSTGIYLIGFLSLVLLQQLYNFRSYSARQHLKLATLVFCAFAVVIGYYLYNSYLNTKYGSTIFLAKANPFDSIEHLKIFYYDFFLNIWIFEYFCQLQYLILFILILPVLVVLVVRRQWEYLYLLAVFFLGAVATLYLFGGQLFHHDYYIVPVLIPVVTFFILVALVLLNGYIPAGKFRLLPSAVIAVICLSLFYYAWADFNNRIDPTFLEKTFNVTEPISWAANNRGILDSLNIPHKEPIAVLEENAPNRALVYLDRRGYHIPGSTWIYDVSMAKDIMRTYNLHVLVTTRKTGDYMMQHDPEAFSWYFEPVVMREKIAVIRLK